MQNFLLYYTQHFEYSFNPVVNKRVRWMIIHIYIIISKKNILKIWSIRNWANSLCVYITYSFKQQGSLYQIYFRNEQTGVHKAWQSAQFPNQQVKESIFIPGFYF